MENLTCLIILIVILILILYDFYALYKWGAKATISRVILNKSRKFVVIAFAAGLLCGHLFWSQRLEDDKEGETPCPRKPNT